VPQLLRLVNRQLDVGDCLLSLGKVGTENYEIAKGNGRRIKKGAVMNATQSFAQDRGTGATPAEGAKAGATHGTFTTTDAIPWTPVDPKHHPGLMMFVVGGESKQGRLADPAKVACGHGLGLALAQRGV
jgi:hypothetical protein